jgi:hypothetical protein
MPLLAVVLGGIGLTAWLAKADYVVMPVLFLGVALVLGFTASTLLRRAAIRAPRKGATNERVQAGDLAVISSPTAAQVASSRARARTGSCPIGAPDIGYCPGTVESTGVIGQSVITCPTCHVAKLETMPIDACQFFYECTGCGTLLRPKPGDCCVFCSYGSVPCPPVQQQSVDHEACRQQILAT